MAHTLPVLLLHLLLLLNNFIFIYTDASSCNLIEDKSPNLQLKRHLFCDYDPVVRPLDPNKNKTIVHFILIPKLAEFDDYSDTLDLHCWMYISWKDVHLQWKPEDFSNVESIWVNSYEIWTPDIAIQRSGLSNAESTMPLTICAVSNGGGIVCIPPVRLSTRCVTDYTYWPFDTQNCTIEFSSWSYGGHEISFPKNTFDIVMDHYAPNGQWKITPDAMRELTRKSKLIPNGTYPSVAVDFLLERGYSQLWSIFITPTILLAAMTLTILWLDPASNERLLIALINFLCHFKCIISVHWALPDSGSLPNILLFYHNSVILATVALMLTCFMRKMLEYGDPPPTWITSYTTKILASKPGQILLLTILDPRASARIQSDADDNSDLVGSAQAPVKSTWNHVIILIGWFSFITFFLTYFIMFIILFNVPVVDY